MCMVRKPRPLLAQFMASISLCFMIYWCWRLAVSCIRVGFAIVFGVLLGPSRKDVNAARLGPYYVARE